jgi:hypothetical protein
VVAEDEVVDAEQSGHDQVHRRVVKVNKDNTDSIRLRVPTTVTVESVIEKTAGTEAPADSRWLPVVNWLEWLAIHAVYSNFPDGLARQLVCCSMTYEYYISGHNPTPGQRWQQAGTPGRDPDPVPCQNAAHGV